MQIQRPDANGGLSTRIPPPRAQLSPRVFSVSVCDWTKRVFSLRLALTVSDSVLFYFAHIFRRAAGGVKLALPVENHLYNIFLDRLRVCSSPAIVSYLLNDTKESSRFWSVKA